MKVCRSLMNKSYGLVISEKSYSDADKIITVLMKNYGKISLYVHGAKKLSSQFFAISQIFTCSEFVISNEKKFCSLKQANLIENLTPRNYEDFCYAMYFCEMAEKVLPFKQEANNILLLLIKTLKVLSCAPANYIARIFEFKFMKLNGFEPQINFCHVCNKPYNPEEFFFDGEGLVCKNCLNRSLPFCKISPVALKYLSDILNNKFDSFFCTDKEENLPEKNFLSEHNVPEKINSAVYKSPDELLPISRIFLHANLSLLMETKINSHKFVCDLEKRQDT